MDKKVAVYPGSFDPYTRGHHSLVAQALDMFDEVIILIAKNPKKTCLFNPYEREALIYESIREEMGLMPKEITIATLDEWRLTVNYMKEIGAKILIRSMRSTTEFEQEILMAHHNKVQAPDIKTVFLVPEQKFEIVSSTAAKEMASVGGELGYMVGLYVETALKKKFKK